MRFALLLIIATWLFCACAEPTVKFAAVLYRHGARTPVAPYPTDPYKDESLWPEKFGQLTNTGKMQHFLLGNWLRERYQDLVSVKYDPDEIYIKTTNVDRTIMSAEINTAGLYPPKGSEVWDDKLKWQPVPIHTIPSDDAVLAMQKKCPAYEQEMQRYLNTPDYMQMLQTYRNLMKYVESNAGVNITDFTGLEYVYSTLNIEQETNFVLPEWTHKVFPNAMREPSCFSFYVRTATPVLARLKAGPLLKEITHAMTHAAIHKKAKKLLLYSAHDNTVADLLGVLRVFDVHCPPFTATVFIELLTDNEMDSYTGPMVRISYRNSTEIVEPEVLPVPGCGGQDMCPLHDFLKLYRNVTNIDFDKDCVATTESAGSVLWFMHFLLMSFIFLFIFLYLFIYN